jgi:hypothetical protein
MYLPTFGFVVHQNFIVVPQSLFEFEKKRIVSDKIWPLHISIRQVDEKLESTFPLWIDLH